MLQNMREHAQGWIAWVIAGVLCLAFALWGIEYYIGGSNQQTQPAATVNGQDISFSQWDAAYKRSQQALPVSLDETAQHQLKNQTLQDLIKQTALTQAAAKNGYAISNEQLSAWVINLPDFQQNSQFSPRLFQQIIRQFFPSEQAFLADLHDKAIMLQARVAILNSAFALPHEINHLFALNNQKRDISYLTIPASDFLKTAEVSASDISAYYNAHASEFMTQEQLSLQYLILSADEAASKIVVDETTVKQYYDDNQAAFSTPAQWKIARILITVPDNADSKLIADAQQKANNLSQQISAGQNFATLALRNSADKTTAIKGGLIGWVTATDQPPQLAQAINLLQPGQTSPPIRVVDGFVLIKLIDTKPPQTQPYAIVHDQIAQQLSQQKLSQLLADQSEQLANLVYTNPDSLKPAADALNLKIATTPLFSRDGNKLPLLVENPKFIPIAFSDNVLKQRNNSDVISLDDKHAAVIRVNDYRPSVLRPLADVTSDIEQKLKQQVAHQQAIAHAKKILDALKNGISLTKVAEQNQLTVHEIADLTRQAQDQPAAVIKLAFSLPLSPKNQVVADMTTLDKGDVIIVALNKVIMADPKLADPKQRDQLKQRLADEMGSLEYQLYTKYYLDQAKIKTP